MRNIHTLTIATTMIATLALGAPTAGASTQHGHRKSHKPASLAGPRGRTGATGPQGLAGATGATGPKGETGAQGPGASEYVYNSTAPAGTEQNSPIGNAGPLALTGNCLQLGPKLIMTEVNDTNRAPVQIDEMRTEDEEGSGAFTLFDTYAQPFNPTPGYLLNATATSAGTGETYVDGRLTITAPVHGQLEVFAYASEVTNVCHVSAVWTPAS
jgi:hypothetical protein